MKTTPMSYVTFLLALVILSGCGAPVNLGKLYAEVESEPIDDDVTRLVIYQLDYHGHRSIVNVEVNDEVVGRMPTNSFRRSTVEPGDVTVSANDRQPGESVGRGLAIVLSGGGMLDDVKKSKARHFAVPATVTVNGGSEYFFRVNKNSVSAMEECQESGDEARLCEVTKFETRVTEVPSDLAKQELMFLSEVVDETRK